MCGVCASNEFFMYCKKFASVVLLLLLRNEYANEDLHGAEHIGTGHQTKSLVLVSDVTGFITLIQSCFEAVSKVYRKAQIQKILNTGDLHEHYKDGKTERRVLAHSNVLEHKHEKATAILLAQVNYDVVFVPQALFKRSEKRYDVLLLRDTVIIRADLKSIYSQNPDTIGNRIKEGSDQASRIVLHICSDLTPKTLIQGLRTGCYKNALLKGILLFYRSRFYLLDKDLISSKRIFDVIK